MIKRLPDFRPGLQWATRWAERHWLKLLAALFCAYLASERNLTLQLQLSTQRPSIELKRTATDPPAEAKQTSWQPAAPAEDEPQRLYIERFDEVAQAEMEKYGVPASITLAQGLLESQAGKSPLATGHNNHFGIKCFARNCRRGHCRNFSDDSHKDFFRVYRSAWESYRAHSLLLRREERYQPLFRLAADDYRGWAEGLAKAGYATDPAYAKKLIRLIERHKLYRYDKPA